MDADAQIGRVGTDLDMPPPTRPSGSHIQDDAERQQIVRKCPIHNPRTPAPCWSARIEYGIANPSSGGAARAQSVARRHRAGKQTSSHTK